MKRVIGISLLFGGCTAAPQPVPAACAESAESIAASSTSFLGLSPADALAGFPQAWEVSWARFDEAGAIESVAAHPEVWVNLSLVSAAEVVVEGEGPQCDPVGTKLLRLEVEGSWSTGDGATQGPVEGLLEITDAADPLGWRVKLASEVALDGEDRVRAEAIRSAEGLVTVHAFRAALQANWLATDAFEISLNVLGDAQDGSQVSMGLWQTTEAWPAGE